jgi:hypothetical protein
MKIIQFWIALFAVFCLSQRTIAQETYDGTRKNLQTNGVDAISYTNTTFSKQNVFYNRFSIFLKSKSSKADTIYVVDIIFDKSNSFIDIVQLDKLSNQNLTKTIGFHPNCNQQKTSTAKPTYCVKNYIFNDTLLSVTKDNNADILFTIADTINPAILLHQIVSIDGKKRFDLDKFRKTYLTPHLSHARDYWECKNKAIPPTGSDTTLLHRRRILIAEINKEIVRINADKDSLIPVLNNKHMVLRLADTTANASLQQVFTRKMDDVFTEYFSKPINISAGLTGSYKIHVNTDGSKRIVETFTPDKIPTCYVPQFNAIRGVIDKLSLTNEEVSSCDNNTINIIDRNHSVRFDRFKSEAADLKISLDSTFKHILDPIDVELKKICNEKIKMATTYNYSYQVISEVEWQKWTLKDNKIVDSRDSVIRNPDNIRLFYGKDIKRKRGRYDVSLNTTKFNDHIFGPVLDFVQLDYKFRTYIGFNVGAFIGSKDILNNGITEDDLSQRLWNVFLIYHHFGIFGGSSYNQYSSSANQFGNYGEGGIYVAPGKCFYFKLGLAQYKVPNEDNITKPILGGSLIFPVFHIEGGYNFAWELPYIMAGFNIPINR